MFKHSIEDAARARLALPVVLLLAALAMLVNEAAYHHKTRAVLSAIALTEARVQVARTLHRVTELEAAARAYVATRQAGDRKRFDEAARALLQDRQATVGVLARVHDLGSATAERVHGLISEHQQRLQDWTNMESEGRPSNVRAVGNLPEAARTADLARELDDALVTASLAQQRLRASLFDSFTLSRGAVHALIILAVVALILFARELRRADERQALEHERLEAQIVERTARLRDLAEHLVTAREDERNRLARELHDEMGGVLTAMQFELARLKRLPALPGTAFERIAGFERRLNDSIALKRRIIENLRPSSLEQLGLQVALEMLCADMASIGGLPVHARVQPLAVGKDAELSLFRVAQESLTNVLKHAQASSILVVLRATRAWVQLTVEDNGHGFDPAAISAGRHGILGMRLRIEAHGGELNVDSAPGTGTRISVHLPVVPVRR